MPVIMLAVAAFAQFGISSVSAQPAGDALIATSSAKDLRTLADLFDKREIRAWPKERSILPASAPRRDPRARRR